MATGALRNVELMKAGVWAASTGVTKVTTADLDAIVAAYADGAVDRPVVKIGHDDENTFNAALGDGEPAYGWVENVGRGDGTTGRPNPDSLYGDLVGMPTKLAEVAPAAYRRRSIEVSWGYRAASGKTYAAVLTGVALLGVTRPAVKGLADVLALYGAEPAGTVGIYQGDDVPTIDLAALAAFAAAQPPAPADPVDDTAVVRPPLPSPVNADTEPSGPPAAAPTQEDRMTIKRADVDKALEQAGDEDVTALLRSLLDSTTAPPAAPEAPAAAAPTAPETPVVEAPVAVAASAAPETVTVSAAVFSELQTQAARGSAAADAIDASRRDGIVAAAFSAGKITRAEQAEWRKALDRDETGTVTLLDGMAARFATSPLVDASTQLAPQTDTTDDAAWDEFRAGLIG